METKRADSIRVVHPLFQAEGGGATPTSALQLCIDGIDWKTAAALNRLWHSRLPVIRTANGIIATSLCYGAEFDDRWYAIAIWTNPIAAALPQDTWFELRRFAIAPDAPRNTASRMLAVMARLIRKQRPAIERLVSYQDAEVHTGCIYAAAGWTRVQLSSGGDWTGRVNRSNRRPSQTTAPKWRWEKVLYERAEVG